MKLYAIQPFPVPTGKLFVSFKAISQIIPRRSLQAKIFDLAKGSLEQTHIPPITSAVRTNSIALGSGTWLRMDNLQNSSSAVFPRNVVVQSDMRSV